MEQFQLGDRIVDLVSCTVRAGSEVHELTPIEVKLLEYLARRAGEVVGRDELMVEVWGYRPGVRSRTIDNTASRLRTKIEDDPSAPRHLHALYGRGLRLDEAVPLTRTAPSTRFVGRAEALADLVAAVNRGARLVTVWGPAGAGKTRLVTEVLPRLTLSPVIVPCASVRDEAGLDAAVAGALGVVGATPAVVVRALGARGAVAVVLDECERAAGPIGARVGAWLAQVPRLRVLATSRIGLGVAGEQLVALGPLSEPDGIALFVDRARLRDPRFDADPDQIRPLVVAVDALPLALELAAARVHLTGLPALLALVRASVGVLASAEGASMAAVVEHSWSLLEPAAQRVLRDACVLEGPFALDDLAAVAGIDAGSALHHVDALVAHALIRVVGEGSYAPYAVVREWVRRAGADPEALRRHAAWFGRLGERAPLERGRFDAALRRRLVAADADLRAVLARRDTTDPAQVARCAAALVWRAAREGPIGDGLAVVQALDDLPCEPRIRVALAIGEAVLGQLGGALEPSLAALDRGIAIAADPPDVVQLRTTAAITRRLLGDVAGTERELAAAAPYAADAGIHQALWLQTRANYATSFAEAEPLLIRAAGIARRYGDRLTEGASYALAAHLSEGTLAWDHLRGLYRRALDVFGADELAARHRGAAFMMFARTERRAGALDAAERLLEEAITLCDRVGRLDTLYTAQIEQARVWLARGWDDDAYDLVAPIAIHTIVRPERNVAHAHLVLGLLAEARGDRVVARRAAEAALDHGVAGRWWDVETGAHELLAVLDDDATAARAHVDAAHATETAAGGPWADAVVRRWAIRCLVETTIGDVGAARDALAAAIGGLDGLGVSPEADVVRWIRRAERELAIRAGDALSGRFGTRG
ncbi:MAG: winged helix-turn-helix domain-containing protein [Myxococcota bacterium]